MSTGPRTIEGKAVSSLNSLKHGLSAEKHVFSGEVPDGFASLLRDLELRFLPVGDAEFAQIFRIAAAQMRLSRTPFMEVQIFRSRLDLLARLREINEDDEDDEDDGAGLDAPAPRPPASELTEGELLGKAFELDCQDSTSLARLVRYETDLERSIDRCIRQLEKLQKIRAAHNQKNETNPIKAGRRKPPK
ncbi:MAG TPA: hypothetical protein VKR61_25105 [Bryobacteraceae bacterium]|nr:hypothetical protein [Bryobacteraceae bacterium]